MINLRRHQIKKQKNSDGAWNMGAKFSWGRNKWVSYRDLGGFIRERGPVHITSEDGFDYTKESLIKHLIGPKQPQKLVDLLEALLPIEVLYEVIYAGGAENFLLKRAHGRKNDREIESSNTESCPVSRTSGRSADALSYL